MRKHLIFAGIAAASLIPTLAMAQETCEQRSAHRAEGTAIGAVAGALLGSAVAGHGEKGTGAVVGGIGGAIIGNQASRGPRDCAHAYGYYDNDNRWHDNGVDRSVAYGYYDRNGVWIDGAPPNVAGYSANAAYSDRTSTDRAYTDRAYTDRGYSDRAHSMDVDTRIARIDERIDRGRADGTLSRREARRAMDALNDIKRDERRRMRYGQLSDRDQAMLQRRLDDLSARVRMDRETY